MDKDPPFPVDPRSPVGGWQAAPLQPWVFGGLNDAGLSDSETDDGRMDIEEPVFGSDAAQNFNSNALSGPQRSKKRKACDLFVGGFLPLPLAFLPPTLGTSYDEALPVSAIKRRKPLGAEVMLTVVTLTGRREPMLVDPKELVLALKERLEAQVGVPMAQQRLVYKGKTMADYNTFEHYNVEEGDIVHIITALIGG